MVVTGTDRAGRLAVAVIGPPSIEVDGQPLEVDTRKAVALLARVAVTGGDDRETLAALLWPDADETRARAALRRTLSVLNKALGGVGLDAGRTRVRLTDEAWTDVGEFDRIARGTSAHEGHRPNDPCDECLSALERVASLHRGDLLAGFTLRDSADFDDWCFVESERLRHTACEVLDRLVHGYARRHQFDSAIEHGRHRLALDPLHEPTHRRLMLLHAWRGERNEAIHQYRRCVAVLQSDLGVAPLQETTALYESIVAGPVPPPPAPQTEATGAPSPPTPARRTTTPSSPAFVGRDRDLAVVVDAHAAATPDGRLVVVEGEAGIGKTRLVEEAAGRVRAAGAQAVVVRCYPGEERLAYAPIADALRHVALDESPAVSGAWLSEVSRLVPELLDRGSDLPPPPPLDGQEAHRRFYEGVRQVLGAAARDGRPALIAFEDVQWADTASRQVLTYLARRLRGTSVCLVLSWRTEEVGADHPLRRLKAEVRGSGEAAEIALERLGREEVAELARAHDVADDETIDRLHVETEGLPLFVVEYLRALGAGQLGAGEGSWPVPVGVRDLVALRLGAVSDGARQVLTAAAVIGRSFALDALLHVSGRSDEEIVDALEELVDSGFIVGADDAHGAEYDFRHNHLRTVVYETASIARRRILHGRVADQLGRRARGAEPGATSASALLAHHLRLAGRDDEAAAAFAQAGSEAAALSAHADAVEHLRTALALGHPDAGPLHAQIGDLLVLVGDYRRALDEYEAAAAVTDDPLTVAGLEQRIARVHERRGDWAAADAHVTAALDLLTDAGDIALRARLEADASLTHHRRGDRGEARRRAERSLALAEEAGDNAAVAQAHNLLGMVARAEGDATEAVGHLERSLAAAEAADDPTPTVAALNNLALALADQARTSEALETAKTALALCRRQGDRHREAAILNNLADLLREAGQEDEAMSHLKRAVALFAEVGAPEEHEPEIWKLVDW